MKRSTTSRPHPSVAAARLKKFSGLRPSLAIILGSGFHHILDLFQPDARVPYRELPGFPPAGVSGHTGELLFGRLANTEVLILSGRSHFYEGYPMSVVTFAVRTLAHFGVRDLLVTNAAGAVNPRFRVGDFMVLTDHINMMGCNPLRGESQPDPSPPALPGSSVLPGFVDLSQAYDPGLSKLLRRSAVCCGIKLRSGIYLAVSGPSYETPAEIRAFARLGADAVGMSTVPEVIVARQCGLRVAGLSCITNLAAGLNPQPLSHKEVLETAQEAGPAAARLIREFARLYAQSE